MSEKYDDDHPAFTEASHYHLDGQDVWEHLHEYHKDTAPWGNAFIDWPGFQIEPNRPKLVHQSCHRGTVKLRKL